jgi:hypothetical protein
MSTIVWRGDAPVTRQVDTFTPTASNSQTYTITINGKSVSYTADSGTTVQEICEGLQAALAASTIPEFAEITWTENDSVVTGTGPDDGTPFTATSSATGAGALAQSTVTAAVGPNRVVAANFVGAALPTNGDTLVIQDSASSLNYSLSALSAVTVDLLNILADFSEGGEIGLPYFNRSNSGGAYYEYRGTYLQIGATEVKIGDGNGQGSGLIKLNLGSVQTSIQVFKTGQPTDQDYGAVQLIGTHASNVLRIFGGSVDVAMGPGEVATFATITASGGVVRLGGGCTLTTVEADGNAVVEVRSAATTLQTQGSGIIRKIGSGAVGTIDVGGGTVEYSAAGTITTLVVRAGKTFDASRLTASVTITNSTCYAGATILDPNGKITWTNATSCPDGADSVRFVTKKGATVKVA